MSRKRNWVRRDEFRKNRSKGAGGHPAYIYAKVGNRYRFLGITHSPVTQGVKNIPLEKNPNPNDARPSYMRPKARSENVASFGKVKEGWKLSEADKNGIKKHMK